MPGSQHGTPVSDARVARLIAQTGHGRDLLCETPARLRQDGVRRELSFRLRLPSYRSLPLSCIESLRVVVDGQALATDQATLVLDGVPFRLPELGSLPDVWWFILDEAVVRLPAPASLSPGLHELDVSLARVEPYITAGRFTFTTRCAKRLDFIQDATP
jgi:hypothetical protein